MKKGVGKLITGGIIIVLAGFVGPLATLLYPILTTRSVATITAPEAATFELEKPRTLTLWYEYYRVLDGRTYRTGSDLPSGWSFHLEHLDNGTEYRPVQPGMTMTRNTTGSESAAIGNFKDLPPGAYEFRATGPGDTRVFSLAPAWFSGDLTSLFLSLVLCVTIALLGVAWLVLGLYQVLKKPEPHEVAPRADNAV